MGNGIGSKDKKLNTQAKNRWFKYAQAALFVLLVGYVGYRAANLSFTHDEATTYTIAAGDRNPGYTISANHHILNSHLMSVTGMVFGFSEFSMRLPNVLLFVVYILMCFKFIQRFSSIWLKVFFLSLILLNPFLLEYFSLARGYGISLGFLMVSLWFFLKDDLSASSINKHIINYFWSIGFASLMLWANASTINIYIALMCIFVLQSIRLFVRNSTNKITDYAIYFFVFVASCFPLFMAVRRLLFLKKRDQLYYGANHFNDMLDNLSFNSLFLEQPSTLSIAIKFAVVMLFVYGIFYAVQRKIFDGPFFKIILLMLLIVMGIGAENVFFDAKFPLERTAIYFIPLMGLFVFYFWVELTAKLKPAFNTKATPILSVSLTILLAANLIVNASIHETYKWKYDAHVKEVAKILEQHASAKGGNTLSNNWLFEPTLNYYIVSRNLPFNKVGREGIEIGTDFIYDFSNNPSPEGYIVLREFPDNTTTLYKRELKQPNE